MSKFDHQMRDVERSLAQLGGKAQAAKVRKGLEKKIQLYQRREILTRRGFPSWYRCDSRLAKEIRHVSMHCTSERLRRR